jgi:hypothetical protein
MAKAGYYECFNHNFYWYEDSELDLFTFVPWDLQGVLGGNVHVDSFRAPTWDDPSEDCTTHDVQFGLTIELPQCDPMLRFVRGDLGPELRAASHELLDGPFTQAAMEAAVQRWRTRAERAYEADGQTIDAMEMQQSLENLLYYFGKKREHVETWLDKP